MLDTGAFGNILTRSNVTCFQNNYLLTKLEWQIFKKNYGTHGIVQSSRVSKIDKIGLFSRCHRVLIFIASKKWHLFVFLNFLKRWPFCIYLDFKRHCDLKNDIGGLPKTVKYVNNRLCGQGIDCQDCDKNSRQLALFFE